MDVDVAVIGGGVAGLWTAWRLQRDGHRVVVIERSGLGSGQSVASQGIIHGGIKYTLSGEASAAARAVAAMPPIWKRSMTAPTDQEPDLRSVRVLCPAQYLWSEQSLLARVTAKVAAAAIAADVSSVSADKACAGLRGANSGVSIHSVDEPVVDPRSVVASLHDAVDGAGGAIVAGEPVLGASGEQVLRVGSGTVRFSTLVLAAGAGNERLLGGNGPRMQRRPLHMVMARGDLPELFGHCLAALADKPRLTITSQRDGQGRVVWYIGGLIAEQGVHRARSEQIERARDEVRACLPWIDVGSAEWATLSVDRAEGLTAGGGRPDVPVVERVSSFMSGGAKVVCAWPTKLVFAPLVASRVSELVGSAHGGGGAVDQKGWLRPPVARLPWEEVGVRWS